jgi:hypothetical protein
MRGVTRIVAVAVLAALLAAVLMGGTTTGSAAAYRRFYAIGEQACFQGPENVMGAAGIVAATRFASDPGRYPPGAQKAFADGCRAANLGQ